jgi:GNAT superfamily N-acetyltransferase
MAAPPVFRINPEEWERDYIQGVLIDSSRPVWLAEQKGIPVAFISAAPDYTSACYIIRDEKTISLVAAFTEPVMRKSGVMTALLDTVFTYARDAGFVRCSTDYEPENFAGVGLWSRYFTPVCHSLIRTVDRRANKIYWQ